MERQEVSQDGCGSVGGVHLDVSKLGDGAQAAKANDQGRASSPDGAAPRVKKKRVRNYTPEEKEKWRVWKKNHYQATKHLHKQILTPAQKERKRLWTLRRYQARKEHCRRLSLNHYYRNREAILAKKAEQRRLDPSIKEKQKKYDLENAEAKRARSKAWIENNKERAEKNRLAYLPRRRELCKLRRAENPQRRIAENCRSRVYNMVTKFNPSRTYKTFDLVGCTPDFFVAFLEAQFKPEMNWENYGTYWNIDHVLPLASFNLQDGRQLRQAFHYSNCRPLEAEKNSEKNDSLPGPHQPLLV